MKVHNNTVIALRNVAWYGYICMHVYIIISVRASLQPILNLNYGI